MDQKASASKSRRPTQTKSVSVQEETTVAQKVIKPVTDPVPTTYRPVFITPTLTSVKDTPGYTYSTPPAELQLLFDKPSTPSPGLPFLYGPPARGRRGAPGLSKSVR